MPKFKYEAVILDFDGVLIESVDIKTRSFAELYRPYGEEIAARVAEYSRAHDGVSRYIKLRYCHQHFLGKELSPEEEARLAQRFSEMVEQAVIQAPYVRGAKEFLDAHFQILPLFVATGTPDVEIHRIIDQRQMRHYFRGVRGYPPPKNVALKEIVETSKLDPRKVVMVGDTMVDFESAQSAQTQFIGRVSEGRTSPFPPHTPTLPDLTQLETFLLA